MKSTILFVFAVFAVFVYVMCFVSSAPTAIVVPRVAMNVRHITDVEVAAPNTLVKDTHPRSDVAFPGLFYGYDSRDSTTTSSASFKPSMSISTSSSTVSLKAMRASACVGPWCVMYGSVCLCVPEST